MLPVKARCGRKCLVAIDKKRFPSARRLSISRHLGIDTMPTSSKRRSSKSRKTPSGKKPDILNLVGLEGPLKGVVYDRRDTTILKHARIYWDTSLDVWMVQDRGSSNGTFLNLIEVIDGAVELRDGDILEFSDTNRFEVQISPCSVDLTKREFFHAEMEIFAKRLKARSELQMTRMLKHWNEAKVKILEKSGYKVEHAFSMEEDETEAK